MWLCAKQFCASFQFAKIIQWIGGRLQRQPEHWVQNWSSQSRLKGLKGAGMVNGSKKARRPFEMIVIKVIKTWNLQWTYQRRDGFERNFKGSTMPWTVSRPYNDICCLIESQYIIIVWMNEQECFGSKEKGMIGEW